MDSICESSKSNIKFKGFAREPLWAPRLLEAHTQIVNIIICKYYIHT